MAQWRKPVSLRHAVVEFCLEYFYLAHSEIPMRIFQRAVQFVVHCVDEEKRLRTSQAMIKKNSIS